MAVSSVAGRFVTFEGIEGVGKSTQLAAAEQALRGRGRELIRTREPGGTALGERIRGLLLEPGEPIGPGAELLLLLAARAEHVERVIRPALSRGALVLCDRYSDATFAYQGAGRGVPLAQLRPLAEFAERGVRPDLTILLDAPVALALSRARQRSRAADRFEGETEAFFERARSGYLERARAEPGRIRTVDASRPVEAVAQEIGGLLDALLDRGMAR